MPDELLNFLDKIGFGTAILIIVFLGGVMVSGYKTIKDFLEKRDKNIREAYHTKEEFDDLKTSVDNLTRTVNDIHDGMVSFHENVSNDILKINDNIASIQTDINTLKDVTNHNNDKIKLLIDGDKQSIKSYIIEEYDRHVKGNEPISITKMELVENLYSNYLEEEEDGKDELITTLMKEIRKVPKK